MIKLTENVDLNQVATLKEQIIHALQKCGSGKSKKSLSITIDVSNVENITTPLLQLLLITKTECDKQKAVFSILNPSDKFRSIIQDFGCLEHFEGTLS